MEKLSGLALALILAGSPALADPAGTAVEEAKAHFKTGTELYDENNFRGALVELQRAYDLAPSYRILFNIGQVDMELQDYAGALTAYTRYLREGGSEVPADRVTLVTTEIERLRGRVGHITVQTAPGAEILVDKLSVGFAPLPDAVTVNTGRHEITVHVANREPASRVVDVAGQQQLTVVLENEPVAVVPVKPEVKPDLPIAKGPPSKVPMIASLAATGGLAIVTTVFAISAHSDQSALATLRQTYPTTKAALDAKVSSEKRAAAFADGFGIATLVAAGVAAYVTLHYRSAAHEHELTVSITPTGAILAGRF